MSERSREIITFILYMVIPLCFLSEGIVIAMLSVLLVPIIDWVLKHSFYDEERK